MPVMTGGQAVLASIEAGGVDTIFGIPGVHTAGIYDALLDRPNIRHVMCRHEQGAGFMADGYARASGRIACALTITGPGVTNIATPLGEAQAESSPVLHVCTTLESSMVGRDVGYLHELRDQSGLVGSIVGWHRRVRRVSDIPGAVADALHHMRAGRPGPASIEIPLDLVDKRTEVRIPRMVTPEPLEPVAEVLRQAIKLLVASVNPVILAGGGVVAADASKPLIEVAEKLSAPVFTTVNGKGAIPEDHPLSVGCRWRGDQSFDRLVSSADAMLVVGSRLSARNTDNWRLPLPRNIIQIDIDSRIIGRHYPAVKGIHAHARPTLEEMARNMPTRPLELHRNRIREIEAIRRSTHASGEEPAVGILAAVREALPRDGLLFNDMTTVCYQGPRHFPVYQPRTFFSPVYFGTLGFSVPAAIGAKVAMPERKVVALVGDGGFMFTSQELSTALALELPLPIVVLNDGGYMELEVAFRRTYGRTIECSLETPDFVRLGRAFGVSAVRVASPSDLCRAIRAAYRRRRPTVIDYTLN
ncbi:MAG: thiamine pyrophosphate-binding protein [Chloroflexi bacterium]|nr:thiamine pyrophosphate-binding protein [Chloroflexota bacterium]